MKYAFALDMPGEHAKWTLLPWKKKGLRVFDYVRQVPDGYILISSHFAPWWTPLKEYIAEGRPVIEIEYGYWGPDTPRRETRRITYNGHHNIHMRPVPYSRSNLFPVPAHKPWKQTPGEYVLAIQPVEEILTLNALVKIWSSLGSVSLMQLVLIGRDLLNGARKWVQSLLDSNLSKNKLLMHMQ
jgi:hypothetical protein